MTEQPIKFYVELTKDESLAFAQFLKRLGLSDYRSKYAFMNCAATWGTIALPAPLSKPTRPGTP